ncbi:hypothetical protein [Citrobacter portucalensis]|uniref:hypothetical protein n=1 Tax=Citrobacter portucalensis TaxID=1639133 RepID=UPI0018A6A2EF|nr:hypothetical protein [Citrobacter portucalensis]BBV39716.1 hypothetical protein STW0522CIT26_11880 [Citrobacter portucalensis]BBW10670.1 hypothetical protein STN0717CIT27_11460 [Citrobacter portucalensis]
MNATEKDNVFYCDCGFSWRRGMSGSHNCEDGLRAKLADMAVQLANAESKCRELAAENAWMKNALEWLYETVSSEILSIPDEKYSSVTNAAQVLSETPATDAFLAEVRASALEYYANLFKDTVNMDIKHNQEFHKGTLYVADQLRKGAAL